MQAVIETDVYLRDAKNVGLSEQERAAIVDLVALNPDAGDEMKGTGGCPQDSFCRKGQRQERR